MADGNRMVHANRLAAPASTSCNAPGGLRCGWCGLPPLSGDLLVMGSGDLCTTCSELLRGVDWKALLGPGR